MNEEAYTDDEKELFEILEFLRETYKNTPTNNDKEKKDLEEYINMNQNLEDSLRRFANVRYERKIAKENLYKNRFFEFYEERCEHCKHLNNLQPLREEIGNLELTYYVFKCVNCNKEFNGLHNTDEGFITWNDHIYKLMTEPHPDGGTLAHKAKISPQEIKGMKQRIDDYKETVRKEKEEDEVQRKNDESVAENVRNAIVTYTLEKHKLMSGNKTIGES